jgi:hypothetical protein
MTTISIQEWALLPVMAIIANDMVGDHNFYPRVGAVRWASLVYFYDIEGGSYAEQEKLYWFHQKLQ